MLTTDPRRVAVVASVALHGIVILALAGEPWPGRLPRPPIHAQLVYLSPPAPPPMRLPQASTMLPETAETAAARMRPEPPAASPPVEPERDADEEGRQADVSTETAPPAAAEAPIEPSPETAPPQDDDVADEAPPIDFNEVGRQAVRAYLDRIESERQARRFDPDLPGDEPGDEPGADSGAAPSVFESNSSSRAVLRPNQGRSRFVRRVARICNELTGGVSLFGLVGLCADSNARRDLFAQIKPRYLDELPECEEVALTPEGQAIVAAGDFRASAAVSESAGATVATATKCRMVSRDALERSRQARAAAD